MNEWMIQFENANVPLRLFTRLSGGVSSEIFIFNINIQYFIFPSFISRYSSLSFILRELPK